jgi:methionyl-tRNA formyltransferase
MLRTIFLGTPGIAATILETLCQKGLAPLAVFTQPARAAGRGKSLKPSEVETFAKNQSLTTYPVEDINHPSVLDIINQIKPDVIIVVAFGQILKSELLKYFCINIHASLLPKYRGAAPVQRAIWNGDKTTGITIQKIVRKLDAGDILLQKSISINQNETSESLLIRLAKLGGEALIEALSLIKEGNTTGVPQDEKLVTFAPKITKEESLIDWNLPATKLHNQIRALQPWPVAESFLGDLRIKIFKASVVSQNESLLPGQISTDHKKFLTINCGKDALALEEVQLENRKRLAISDFLRSLRG